MEEVVKQRLNFAIENISEDFRDKVISYIGISKMESPIEQLFFIEWQRQMITDMDFNVVVQGCLYLLYPQFEIKQDDKVLYRVDFAIFQIRDFAGYPTKEITNTGWGWNTQIAIELDSFAFHEKTKEQFEYEKKRDRDLSTAGWKIIRFSGSEIMRSVGKCVDEVKEYLSEEIEGKEIDQAFKESQQ